MTTLKLTIRLDRELDGRWLAEVPALPGVLALAHTRDTALRQAKALALETLADLAALDDSDIADAIHFDATATDRSVGEVLDDPHRLNVATSRGRCAATLVASPLLFEPAGATRPIHP